MDALVKAVLSIYGLAFLVFAILLVIIIVKRRKSREKENFERRDN